MNAAKKPKSLLFADMHKHVNLSPVVMEESTPIRSTAKPSFAAQVQALEVGECASRVIAVPQTMVMFEWIRDGAAMRDRLRNNCAPAVKSAVEKTGADYRVEVSEMLTTSGRIYIVAIITRLN